jgi:hypothetical protein
MSKSAVQQWRRELRDEQSLAADKRKHLKLKTGSTYQGVLVTEDKKRLWADALRRHEANIRNLEQKIADMERTLASEAKKGKRR